MSELSRLVWRFEAGYLLREGLRDRFIEEAERLRNRLRLLTERRTSPEADSAVAKIERSFDDAIRTAERNARLDKFAASLLEIRRAESAADTIEELCAACAAIESAETQLADRERGLRALEFSCLGDFRIMVGRSRKSLEEEEFQVASFIAEEALRGLRRLAVVAPEGQPCPAHITEAAVRQEGLAYALATLDIGSKEAQSVRGGVEAVRECLAERRFDLAAAMLGDLEAAHGAIETFMSQKSLAERMGMSECIEQAVALLDRQEERSDTMWRDATAMLMERSLTVTSRHTRQKVLAAAGSE